MNNDEALYFSLYKTITKFEQYLKAVLGKYNLTPAQFLMLKILTKSNPLTSKGLNSLTGLDPSTLSGMLQRLRKAGFIKVSKDKRDLRMHPTTLSQEGHDAFLKGKHVMEAFEDCLSTGITASERTDFFSILFKLDTAMYKLTHQRFYS